MSIHGVGIDIVEVKRLERLAKEWDKDFLNRVFTEDELDYCTSRRRVYEHLSGRFATKEAVVKALGKKLPWKSIEVLSKSNGKPFVSVDGSRENFPNENLHISITHLPDYALAIAILER